MRRPSHETGAREAAEVATAETSEVAKVNVVETEVVEVVAVVADLRPLTVARKALVKNNSQQLAKLERRQARTDKVKCE